MFSLSKWLHFYVFWSDFFFSAHNPIWVACLPACQHMTPWRKQSCSLRLQKWLLGGTGLLFINARHLINLSESAPHPEADNPVQRQGSWYTHTLTHTYTKMLSVSVDTVQMLAAAVPNESGAAGQQPEPLASSNDMFTIILLWDLGDTHMCLYRLDLCTYMHPACKLILGKGRKWTNGKPGYQSGGRS